jgi:hypothetical protein
MSTELHLEPVKARDYTTEQVDQALQTVALYGGNLKRAATTLNMPRTTLFEFRDRYPMRYQAACERHAQHIEGGIITKTREVVSQAATRALNALEASDDAPDSKTLAEYAKAAQSFATVAGIGSDKVLLWTGRPTDIQVHTTVEDILRSRQREYTPYVGPEQDAPSPPGRQLSTPSDTQNARPAT